MLLQLPIELLEQILLQLDPHSLTTCALLSREFNTLICSSIALQYSIACHIAGVSDNIRCNLPCVERYEALLGREMAWRRLQPAFTKTFDVTHQPSSIYDLTAGVYLLGNTNCRDIHYCILPSTPNDVPQWTAMHAYGPNYNWNGEIIDMGMAVYEHDLIANVISSPLDTPGTYVLEIILLQFSTGERHPLAQYPRIYVQDSSSRRPAIAMEIVGDNLALVVNNRGGRFRDKLFIFNWKTGHKKLYHEAVENAYASLFFVSPEILIVPNIVQGQYEVWKIPSETASVPHQMLGLRFPALSRGHFILNLSCRGEPNPFLHDTPQASSRPFHTSVDNAIIITVIRLASFPGLLGSTFTLVMHRRALLDTITNLTSPDKPHPPGIHRHYNDALVSNSTSDMPYSLSSAATMDAHAPDSAPALGAWYGWYSIPWSAWGPPISRWFNDDQSLTKWITTSAGQRWAVLKPVNRINHRISIVDFNPYNIHNVPSDLPGNLVVEQRGALLSHGNAFSERIEMGLSCTVYTAPELYNFDGLLMEEDKLLGLKTNDFGNVEEITVFYFG